MNDLIITYSIDPARLTLHTFQLVVAILFFVVGYIIFYKAESRTTMSKGFFFHHQSLPIIPLLFASVVLFICDLIYIGYLLKHTKPMLLVILFFALNAIVNFSTYLYSYILADNSPSQFSCSKLMNVCNTKIIILLIKTYFFRCISQPT